MRALLQRVSRASVSVDGDVVGQVASGVLLLVGISKTDTEREAEYLAAKIANLRIFPDADGRMNKSILDTSGSALVVSQFTLFADVRKGRRPSYIRAAEPVVAVPLLDHFVSRLEAVGVPVERGVFGAMMEVELVNDGPVTIWLDSDELLG